MTNPNGFRADSTWIPNASRAGALHATQRYATPRHLAGPKAPCIVKVVDARAGEIGSERDEHDRLDAWRAPLAVGAIS